MEICQGGKMFRSLENPLKQYINIHVDHINAD
jgi:hypothetical protein